MFAFLNDKNLDLHIVSEKDFTFEYFHVEQFLLHWLENENLI